MQSDCKSLDCSVCWLYSHHLLSTVLSNEVAKHTLNMSNSRHKLIGQNEAYLQGKPPCTESNEALYKDFAFKVGLASLNQKLQSKTS